MQAIPPDIHQEIMRRLEAVEREKGVRILLAIESGSRAWGFASPNSDFDVRFIYVRPRDWYLSIDGEEKRDVIEYKIVDDIDLNGWDVRKALQLFWRCNPAFVEWIQSPLQYMASGAFAQTARELLPEIYSWEKGIYHYRSMAKTNYRGYLRTETVPLKKYFYVLRPLLAVRWLETYRTAAPIEFERLLPLVSKEEKLLEDIHTLLEKKKRSAEREHGPPVASLNTFIERELARLESFSSKDFHRTGSIERLNDLFRAILLE